MRVVTLAIILAVVGTVGYVGLFKQDWIAGWWRTAKGYTPAKTPTEALDRFRDAVKKHDYEAAALYCSPDYAEQIKKASAQANTLAVAIDNLSFVIQENGLTTDKNKYVLRLLEPFPREIKYDVKEAGDGRALATITEDVSGVKPADLKDWNVDQEMIRTLAGGMPLRLAQPTRVEVRQEGEGDKKQWKIYFPVTSELRNSAEKLKANGKNYAAALTKVKDAVKNEATTRADVDGRLKMELEEARK